MPEDVPPGLTPFVFSDPLGKRWPRLRTLLLITSVLVFLATVLFVETLFIAPRMTAPFSLRQLKGQLKSLQTQNPAGQRSAPNSLLWQKFEATKQAALQGLGKPLAEGITAPYDAVFAAADAYACARVSRVYLADILLQAALLPSWFMWHGDPAGEGSGRSGPRRRRFAPGLGVGR